VRKTEIAHYYITYSSDGPVPSMPRRKISNKLQSVSRHRVARNNSKLRSSLTGQIRDRDQGHAVHIVDADFCLSVAFEIVRSISRYLHLLQLSLNLFPVPRAPWDIRALYSVTISTAASIKFCSTRIENAVSPFLVVTV